MKRIFLFLSLFLTVQLAFAQQTTIIKAGDVPKGAIKSSVSGVDYPMAQKKPVYKVAVLCPLFLDSVDISRKLTKLPSFMMPGIEFYQGVQIAADTMRKMGHHFDIYIFDSKSKYMNIANIIASDRLDSMDLILANASKSELALIANYAKSKKINCVSAISPSEANQTDNPYFTILQPRLSTHVEWIHKAINRKYADDNVIFVHNNKTSENNAFNYFYNDEVNRVPTHFKEYVLDSYKIDSAKFMSLIDSNFKTTVILATLNPKQALANLKALLPFAQKLNLKVFGMPTMESIKTLSKTSEFPLLPIYHTSPFINDKISPGSRYIKKMYRKKMGSDPSDLTYKGFESMFFFANLINKYGVPFNKHIGSSRFKFITPYKILPVKEGGNLRFYENKYLYLKRYENGVLNYE